VFRESDFMTTILIIDDSQLARNMVSGMVRGARPDWLIVTAKNADDALEKVNDFALTWPLSISTCRAWTA
jgi:CheY-like chemotaxis protein